MNYSELLSFTNRYKNIKNIKNIDSDEVINETYLLIQDLNKISYDDLVKTIYKIKNSSSLLIDQSNIQKGVSVYNKYFRSVDSYKICKKCNNEYPSSFYYKREKLGKIYFFSYCKNCYSNVNKDNRIGKRKTIIGIKKQLKRENNKTLLALLIKLYQNGLLNKYLIKNKVHKKTLSFFYDNIAPTVYSLEDEYSLYLKNKINIKVIEEHPKPKEILIFSFLIVFKSCDKKIKKITIDAENKQNAIILFKKTIQEKHKIISIKKFKTL